ncbi:hypothetical protein AB1L05_02490 [Cytobacillus horneckiae]
MKELVGNCCNCKKDIYCMDGFLHGTVVNGLLYCFSCQEPKA